MEPTPTEQLILSQLAKLQNTLNVLVAEKKQTTYSVADVALALGVHTLTIRNRINKGEIKAKKSGHNFVISAKEFVRITTDNN